MLFGAFRRMPLPMRGSFCFIQRRHLKISACGQRLTHLASVVADRAVVRVVQRRASL